MALQERVFDRQRGKHGVHCSHHFLVLMLSSERANLQLSYFEMVKPPNSLGLLSSVCPFSSSLGSNQ